MIENPIWLPIFKSFVKSFVTLRTPSKHPPNTIIIAVFFFFFLSQGYWILNERMMLMKLKDKPFNLVIIQVHAPTTDYSDEDVEKIL